MDRIASGASLMKPMLHSFHVNTPQNKDTPSNQLRLARHSSGPVCRSLHTSCAVCPPVLQGVSQLSLCLSEETDDLLRSATVWSIGQLGHHSPEHAKAVVANTGLLPRLLELYMEPSSSQELQTKVRMEVRLES